MNSACLLVMINDRWELKKTSTFALCQEEAKLWKPFKTKIIHSFNKNKYL